eukprot:scaffold34274_cov157-Skeletonema_marinoi.AAC.2
MQFSSIASGCALSGSFQYQHECLSHYRPSGPQTVSVAFIGGHGGALLTLSEMATGHHIDSTVEQREKLPSPSIL